MRLNALVIQPLIAYGVERSRNNTLWHNRITNLQTAKICYHYPGSQPLRSM
ncbi:hypothetical protein Plhal304r1_c082g0167421 [Plasmopara halstedii]